MEIVKTGKELEHKGTKDTKEEKERKKEDRRRKAEAGRPEFVVCSPV